MSKFRVMLTGGGSGGHIYPIIGVATELQLECAKLGIDLRLKYLGSCGDYREQLEANNIKVTGIVSNKVRRYFSLLNLFEAPKFILGLLQALWGTYWFMPDVLFSKGGPGAFAVVLAARFYRIPVVIHESDSIPGLTNSLSAKYAKVISTSFGLTSEYLGNGSILVGNPLRKAILANIKINKEQAKTKLGFDEKKPLIFVCGGSLGSVRINNFILKNLPLILEVSQVLHQTGKDNYEEVLRRASETLADLPEKIRNGYIAVNFLETGEQIQNAYMASDLVVSRAGASTIFEIAAFGKPSILIPLPESAQDHQRSNAYEYESLGAGYMIEEENLLTNLFLDRVINILSDKEKYNNASEAARKFAKPEAALNLARILMRFIN